MKRCLIALLALTFFSAHAQTNTAENLPPGYYVVVASYASNQEEFAKTYTEKLKQDGKSAAFGFDPARRFHHVYVEKFTDFNESVRQMLKTREAGFPTAWVRIIKGTASETTAQQQNSATSAAPIVTAPSAQSAPSVASPVAPEKSNPAQTETQTPALTKAAAENVPAAPSTTVVAEEPKPAAPEVTNNDAFVHPELLTGNTVMLALFNPTNQEQVDGMVELVDTERAKLLANEKGNSYVTLPDPKSKSAKLTLIASSFGYRPVQHILNYKSTEKDSVPDFVDVADNHYRITFGMIRLRRGDIAVLYNVYFFNDASIMLPDSKYELNKLLTMMNENVNYRIKLHGHTNGNGQGKITSRAKDSKEFFVLTSDAKHGFGSAKELSRQRAQTIKDWLVANGIDAKRIEVQAHGGSRMLHDKNSANAKKNVRVEVEMLND